MKNNEVQKKIEFYCTYQERSHKEVTEKLFKMGLKKNTIDEILSNLIQNNFLNEARFANDYCLLYTSPSPRDKRQSRMPGWG